MSGIMLCLVVASVMLAAGCDAPNTASDSSPPAGALVTVSESDGTPAACGGVGIDAVLHGDPNDPRLAWLEPFAGDGPRTDVIWPAGYTARFVPQLEILDERGQVAIRAGDFVEGGCVTDDDWVLLLTPPFLSLRLVCGPLAVPDCAARAWRAADSVGWPERDIVELRFVDATGQFQAIFADGTTTFGRVRE